MGLTVGDYVQTARHLGRVKRGVRGTIIRVDGPWISLRLPEGGVCEFRQDDLIRLVPGEEL
jgi:hypothetical protein